jgi:voltage-gated potassium channel
VDSAEAKYQEIQGELRRAGAALLLLFSSGTLWYHLVEKWTWLDAVYMTVITLATVGFGETNPLGERGRIFTITLILMGVMTIGYVVNTFTDAIVGGYFTEVRESRLRRKLVESFNQHYLICGFGRIGRQIAEEFSADGVQFVVIDSSSEQVEIARESGYTTLQADATLDETLLKLGIEKAICLVAALPSDAENLYIVLSAKTLNPQIRAIARASNEEAVRKLTRAGADMVISPYITGAKRMASAALRPQVLDFVDGIVTSSGNAFYMEEFSIDAQRCPLAGLSLRAAKLRAQSGALVLAVRRRDADLIVGPTGETEILGGDTLICLGTAEQLRAINRLLDPTINPA